MLASGPSNDIGSFTQIGGSHGDSARDSLTAGRILGGGGVGHGAVVGAGGETGLKFCLNDNYSGFCDTRQGYDTNFGNDHWCYYNGYYSCTDYWRWGNVDDAISSVRNYSNRWWKLYEHRSYGGYTLCLRPYGRDNNLGNNTPVEDDISSVKKLGTSRPSGCDKVIG